MKEITFKNEHREKHFEFFNAMELPHFNLVAPVEFEAASKFIKSNRLHFTSVVVYLICKAANSIPELRQRIRGKRVVEHDLVHPSFTVPAGDSGVFSFCYVKYTEDFRAFSNAVNASMSSRQNEPSIEDEKGRDDYLFLSAMPWVHFTGFCHAMRIDGVDSVPRIVWGKMGGAGGFLLPLGIQAHHALVDGRHAGQFFNVFQDLCFKPEQSILYPG
jgi:chloramphenicol O-acetyltransferase type A